MTASSVRLWSKVRSLKGELPLVGLWAGALVGIELFGRSSSAEETDLVAVLVLLALGLLTARQHAARRVVWIGRLLERGRALLGSLRRFRVSMGADLRGRPELEQRMPPLLSWAVLAACLAFAAAWLLRGALPGAWRETLLATSPSLLALYQLVLWSWLGACALLLFLMPLVFLGEALDRSSLWRPHRRRIHGWSAVAYALALVTGATLLPVWAPLALCGVLLVGLLCAALVPGAPRLSILWKSEGAEGPPASFEWTWLISSQAVIHQGLLCGTVLLAVGDRIGGEGGGATPISHFLGLALAWSIPGSLVATFHVPIRILAQGRRRQRARRRPRVLLRGPGLGRDGLPATRALTRAGFEVAGPEAAPERTDVQLWLVEEPHAAADAWPRALTASELRDPAVQARLRRRWEQLCRRVLLRGIERAFKAAARTRFAEGSGFWVAPHHPFVTHLTRDVDESASGCIGEPWRKLIPRPAREYLQDVMGALELDLVFVEDGVRYRELKRVLALIFEHYDIFGPARLDDLRLFAGLPRLRIVVHEFVLEEPYRAPGYPETDYETLGRARILHVYRDRGGEDVPEFTPADFDWMTPPRVPVLA